jgi:hypothetical protein
VLHREAGARPRALPIYFDVGPGGSPAGTPWIRLPSLSQNSSRPSPSLVLAMRTEGFPGPENHGWVKRAGNNQAGLDALKKAIKDAGAAMERLALVAEPIEEAIAEGSAAVKAAVAAGQGAPPPIVMVDYDCHGQPVRRKP